MSEAFKKESVSGYDQINERTDNELKKIEEITKDLDYRIITDEETPQHPQAKASNTMVGAMNDPTYVDPEKIVLADTYGADELELADMPETVKKNPYDSDPNSLNAAQAAIADGKIAGSTLENATLSPNARNVVNINPPNRNGSNFANPSPVAKKTGFFGKLFGR